MHSTIVLLFFFFTTEKLRFKYCRAIAYNKAKVCLQTYRKKKVAIMKMTRKWGKKELQPYDHKWHCAIGFRISPQYRSNLCLWRHPISISRYYFFFFLFNWLLWGINSSIQSTQNRHERKTSDKGINFFSIVMKLIFFVSISKRK